MSDLLSAKQAAGFAAADLIESGMLVGLGTGSTAAFFIQKLGQRCREGLSVRCLATSVASWELGRRCGIAMLDAPGIIDLDITVDGADEIDLEKNMIKGGGGALLREKILATMSREMVVVVDHTKVVQHLGGFPLPVEVIPFAFDATFARIGRLGFKAQCRLTSDGEPYITDGGNRIVDIDLKGVSSPYHEIDRLLRSIPGVLETGFFLGLAGRVIIGKPGGAVEIWESR